MNWLASWAVTERRCRCGARATHDYIRNGTTDLCAALDIATGRVHTQLHSRHRAIEFKSFSTASTPKSRLPRRPPHPGQLRDPLDPAIHRWPPRHPRFHLHFTPTSSSWLNLVGRWFAELTEEKLRRSSHTDVQALVDDITTWTDAWNTNPTPYRWVKTADAIFGSIGSYCPRISNSVN